MTKAELHRLRQSYHRPQGQIVPVEIRVISDLLEHIKEQEKRYESIRLA